jgi:hypothetical protein
MGDDSLLRKHPAIVAIGADGQLSWEHQVDAKTVRGLVLTQDRKLIVTTDVGTRAFECPSGLADSPWPMDAQNPQRTSRANPKFNQPVEYGNRGSTGGSPVEIRSATLEGIEDALYCYGNWINQKPGLAEDGFLHMTRDGDEGTTFDGEYVDPEAKTLYVRDRKVKVPRNKRHYAALGIEWQEPDTLMSHELLRALVAEHRESFLATEEELRQRVPADLPLVLRLDEWHHPDMSGGQKPSQTKTFQMLADVLVTGEPSRYQPAEPANTHWKHWPMGGAL